MEKVKKICQEIENRLSTLHERCFHGETGPVLLISETYPGLWLEHAYDSLLYAKMNPSKLYLAENTVNLFIRCQKEDGQLPYKVTDGGFAQNPLHQLTAGYSQIQECVSFTSLAYQVYTMNQNRAFLTQVYEAGQKWVAWLRNNRMTLGTGLIEMFVGFDTGHDNSGRLDGMTCARHYSINGTPQNASVLPPEDPAVPILAVDMNCNFYGTLKALALIAAELGLPEESSAWLRQAAQVKQKLFELCLDSEDSFFYDVDKNGNKRKYLSSTIFHLFLEGVLDPQDDALLIDELYQRYLSNENHFATPYPYPSMSVSDPSWKKHTPANCWGYFSQGLIALRCTIWMDAYGYTEELDHLCRRFVKGWTDCFDQIKMGQELDPITGQPSASSEWYSSCMLMYLYAAKRLGMYRDEK